MTTLEDKVDMWHNGDGEGLELHEYLGMTWEEYSRWVETGIEPSEDNNRP